MFIYIILSVLIVSKYLEKFSKYEKKTSIFSAAPGALGPLMILAEDAKTDLSQVATSHLIRLIIIIKRIRWDVATWLKSVFASSANIISGPNAPGAAEKIDVFFSYLENFSKYFETIKTLKII